jgi:hypothetical protein
VRYAFELPALPSRHPDLVFDAHIHTEWDLRTSPDRHHDPHATIRTHVRSTVERYAAEEPVSRADVVEDRINTALGVSVVLQGGINLLWASATLTCERGALQVSLDRERRLSEASIRRDEQDQQIEQVEAFKDRVLSRPDMALTYWFMHHPGDVPGNGENQIEKLSLQVSKYASNRYWIQLAQILDDFIKNMTPGERRDSVQALEWWFRRYDAKDSLRRLLELDAEHGIEDRPSILTPLISGQGQTRQ